MQIYGFANAIEEIEKRHLLQCATYSYRKQCILDIFHVFLYYTHYAQFYNVKFKNS